VDAGNPLLQNTIHFRISSRMQKGDGRRAKGTSFLGNEGFREMACIVLGGFHNPH
jgi:hypothetical protein